VLLTILDSWIAHIFGLVALAIAAVAGFAAIGPDVLAQRGEPADRTPATRGSSDAAGR
jgi:hypothetical protein